MTPVPAAVRAVGQAGSIMHALKRMAVGRTTWDGPSLIATAAALSSLASTGQEQGVS
jgi:hypothetical protein